jgi:pimeloyl-ACP methyl ester carboxylesterase
MKATTARRTFAESSLHLADGTRINFARTLGTTDDTTGTDRHVVFIHGWPDSWRSFEPVMAALPHHMPATAFSMPGFGGSDPIAVPARPSDLARAVVECCDALGIADAVFVGHSLGTLVAQRLAERRPDLVSGLVLIGAMAEVPSELVEELGSIVAGFTDPLDEGFVREFQASTLAAPVPEELFETLVTESLRVPAEVWRSTVAGMRADREHAPDGVTAPVLLIWGDQDALAPRDQQDRLLAALPGARLAVYPAAGHSPNWEQPERVAADLLNFAQALGR